MPLVRYQSNFYEIRSLAIWINIKVFNRVNRKVFGLNYLEYPKTPVPESLF